MLFVYRISSQWLIAADKFGPHSTAAVQLVDAHNLAMNFRKETLPADKIRETVENILGKSSHTIHTTNKQKKTAFQFYPHFLQRNAHVSYHSQSIIGRLFDLAYQSSRPLQAMLFETSIAFKLDIDMKVTSVEKYLEIGQRIFSR